MNWKKTGKEYWKAVDNTMENVSPETNTAITITGVAIVGYMIASLSYFAVKGAKHFLK